MEDNNKLPEYIATCRFCGQTRLIQTVGDTPQSELDEIATDQCDCEQAKKYHNRQQKIRKATEWANGYFENMPEVIPLFETAFKAVANFDVESVQIKAGEWTHNITIDSDGYLVRKSGKKVTEEDSFI